MLIFAESLFLSIYFNKYKCRDNFCFKGQGLDHVGTLDNFVVPHWKESHPLSTL